MKSEMGKILSELDRIVSDEEDKVSAEISAKLDKEKAGVDDIIKHIENVEAAANFIDKMTPGDKGDVAFDAEVALRKALSKMRDLSDDVYKDRDNEEDEEETDEI
jgi:hypothetical protein